MSKVTNNVLGPINVKSYNQCIRYNKCQKLQKLQYNILGPINVKSYKQYIRSNKCSKVTNNVG